MDQSDSPDYGFIDADKVNADGSYDLADVMTVITGNGTTTEVKPFYVVPRSVLDADITLPVFGLILTVCAQRPPQIIVKMRIAAALITLL